MAAYLLSENTLTLFHNDGVYTASSKDSNWNEVVQAMKEQDYDKVVTLINLTESLIDYVNGSVMITDYNVFYQGEPVDPVLTQYILRIKKDGFPFQHMLLFIENLYENPSYRSREQLFRWMQRNNVTVTEDGHFVAYKRIKYDWTDVYTGKIDNSPGRIVEMERCRISDDPTELCSTGLHVASLGYLKGYGGERLVAVKVNPADVVSVPVDHDDTKMRVCRYEVLHELPMSLVDENREAWTRSVCNADGTEDDYDDEDEGRWILTSTDPSGEPLYYDEGGDWSVSSDFIQYYDTWEDAHDVLCKMDDPERVKIERIE